jgi:N-acylneuraminate cytidylyltransferase
MLRQTGVKVVVLSSETDPVVVARCRKLDIPVQQGVLDKEPALKDLLIEYAVESEHAVYVGNDVNDIPCFELVGCAVVVGDAQPKALERADFILQRPGGHGAIRELCDLILEAKLEEEIHG